MKPSTRLIPMVAALVLTGAGSVLGYVGSMELTGTGWDAFFRIAGFLMVLTLPTAAVAHGVNFLLKRDRGD